MGLLVVAHEDDAGRGCQFNKQDTAAEHHHRGSCEVKYM